MNPETHRAMLAAQLTTATTLAPYLSADGLLELRAWLRHSDTVTSCAGTTLLGMRTGLLEAVCRRLIDAGVMSLDYAEGCGDVAPAVPDDLAGMSTRAIARVVGVSQSSVRDDLKVSGSYSPAPAIDPTTGEVGED